LTNLLMAAIGLLVAVPAVAYFLGPIWARRPGEDSGEGLVDVGRLADLPVGQWHLLTLDTYRRDGWKKSHVAHAIWVRRSDKANKEIKVLSSICPHLGCPINAHPAEKRFVCPCHGGVFDEEGRKIAGPPPRSMDPLPFEVRSGRLWVRWQDFKIGVPERVTVNA
jgi:Rieske Fe-S protein